MTFGIGILVMLTGSQPQPSPQPVAEDMLPPDLTLLADITPTVTPTPKPTPTKERPVAVVPPSAAGAPLPTGPVVKIVIAAAERYGLDVERFVAMIKCESTFNPRAYNPAGPYVGLGQHKLEYWAERARKAGYKEADWRDPVANANVTAWLVTKAGWGPWPKCGFL